MEIKNFFLLTFYVLLSAATLKTEENALKKKCIIFKCDGGAAHDSAAKALKSYFNQDYEIEIVNIFNEIVSPIDPVRIFTFGKYSGEDFFNFCLRYELSWISNHLWDFGAWGIRKRQQKLEQLFCNYIEKSRPDFLISVIPIFNGVLLSVAQHYNIPFIVVSVDLDATYFLNGISAPQYHKFVFTTIFNDSHLANKIKFAHIQPEQLIVTGFPLRPDFFEPKNKNAIKERFGIPKKKPIILLVMGGAGSKAAYHYMREIAKITLPVHVIICLGRNEQLRAKIEKIPLPDHVTMTILGFTDRMSDLMAISQILVTKPGPTTICEALQMRLPVLLHGCAHCPSWEYENFNFIERNRFGGSVTSLKNLNAQLISYLTNKENYYRIKEAMADYFQQDFVSKVKPVFKALLEID